MHARYVGPSYITYITQSIQLAVCLKNTRFACAIARDSDPHYFLTTFAGTTPTLHFEANAIEMVFSTSQGVLDAEIDTKRQASVLAPAHLD